MTQRVDVLVLGSGAAGLMAALAAADAGARVLVLERAPLLGGTTAISGGQIWVPNNPLQTAQGHQDSERSATAYLKQLTLGLVDEQMLSAFVGGGPEMLSFLERKTGLKVYLVERPDYHSEWIGAGYGRSLEPMPFAAGVLGDLQARLRRSAYRPPLTSAETKSGADEDLVARRLKAGEVTQGAALVAALLAACLERGVAVLTDSRARSLTEHGQRVSGAAYEQAGEMHHVAASSVVVASGGFEWNERLKRAFLTSVDEGAASPPWNDGDGLLMCLRAGAAVDWMTEAWWSAAYAVPGETYDGRRLVRNIVRELALPGSILVNGQGRRFVNEASSYNDLGKAFHVFDPGKNRYVNRPAWLIFDSTFKSSYTVATIAPATPAPAWFVTASSLSKLADKCAIDGAGLGATIDRFNGFARLGVDSDFERGAARHDHYHGDASRPHPNLGELSLAPYYAIPIFLGNLGTKGGMRTRLDGQVLDNDGSPIRGLFACGNAAASWMGPGYPGAGGSLGPIMTASLFCGRAAAAKVEISNVEARGSYGPPTTST